MHKRLVNECLIELEMKTEGPLLIKSGLPGIEGPDMAPVLTFRQRSRPEPYIPGSSLKGVIRSHAERIARTLCNRPAEWRLGACDLFRTNKKEKDWARPDGACAVKFECRKDPPEEIIRLGRSPEKITAPVAYRDSCPACKIFGNTFLVGRLSVPDAYMPEDHPYHLERRDGVGIDRFTGGAAHGAKFDLEVVENATFTTTLHFTNFELWQLGLLACVLYDLGEGLIPIGSGKSRGLGWGTGTVRSIEVRFLTSLTVSSPSAPRLWGLRALEREEDGIAYDYWKGEEAGVAPGGASLIPDPLGVRTIYRLEAPEAVMELWKQVAPLATQRLEQYEIPQRMRLELREQER